MTHVFRSDQPIYTQLIELWQRDIASGALAPGERLPSVRDLAAELGVNPNIPTRCSARCRSWSAWG